MTAAIVPASIGTNPPQTSAALPSVQVASVRWPAHKLHAVILAVLVAVGALVLTGSGQITMWASALTLLAVWWGERALHALRS